MSNVIAFPELPPKSTNRAGANVCAQGSAAGGVLVDLAAVRAEESNWIYGRWDIRELPVDMEDWPQDVRAQAEKMAAAVFSEDDE